MWTNVKDRLIEKLQETTQNVASEIRNHTWDPFDQFECLSSCSTSIAIGKFIGSLFSDSLDRHIALRYRSDSNYLLFAVDKIDYSRYSHWYQLNWFNITVMLLQNNQLFGCKRSSPSNGSADGATPLCLSTGFSSQSLFSAYLPSHPPTVTVCSAFCLAF